MFRLSALLLLLLAPLYASAQVTPQSINCAPNVPCGATGPFNTSTGDNLPTAGYKLNTNFTAVANALNSATTAITGLNAVVVPIPAGDILCNSTAGLAYPAACASLPSTFIVAKANGGNGTATPALTAGSNVTIVGTWPNYTISSTGAGGGANSVVTANGFAGTVSGGGAITLTTSLTGVAIGNGTSLASAGCTSTQLITGIGGCVSSTPTTTPTCSGDTTGATDTPVLQAILTSGKSLLMGECTYYINAALTQPNLTGWSIRGISRRGSIINQVTNNTPIFKLTGNNANNFFMGFFQCQWTTNQTTSQTASNCIQFQNGVSGGNIAEFEVSNIVCLNGFRCLSVAADGENVWGFRVDNSSQGGAMQGAFFAESAPADGIPRISFDNIYLGTFSLTTPVAEPEFWITNADELSFKDVEFNGGYYTGSLPQILCTSCIGVTFINTKAESETIVGGSGYGTTLWSLQGASTVLISVKLIGATINGSNATWIYNYPTSSGYTSIDSAYCNATQGTGSGSTVNVFYKNGTNATGIFAAGISANGLCTQSNISAFTVAGLSNTLVSASVAPLGNVSSAAGSVTAGATGTGTLTLTLPAVQTAWTCSGVDVISQAPFIQSALGTTTSCPIAGTTTSGHAITINALGQ
jgi:hypothetical protein